MLKFLERHGFFDVLKSFVAATPTFGTCAGAILLAKDVVSPAQKSLDALDISVERNAYGRQIDSTILHAETKLPGGPLEMVFIRAPRIVRTGPTVETLATPRRLLRPRPPGPPARRHLPPRARPRSPRPPTLSRHGWQHTSQRMKYRDLIRELEALGWQHVRTKGSHRIYQHPRRSIM